MTIVRQTETSQPPSLPPHFTVTGSNLTLDGHDLVMLAAAHGTPLFVFSERRLRGNAGGFLRAARQGHPQAMACYASKACSNQSVLRVIREEGLAIEINSGGELHKAVVAGFAPQQMVFNGVAKSVAELSRAIECGIKTINVDSPFELRRIAEVAATLGKRAAVTLRLVPGITGGAAAGIQTGTASSKFGMDQDELPEVFAILDAYRSWLDVTGLHIHIGSQVVETDAHIAGVKFAAAQMESFAARLGTRLKHMNLGGGYPTNYTHFRSKDRQRSNQLDHFAAPRSASEMVSEVAGAARRWIGSDLEILFEPGRSLVADTAVLLSRVESVRRRGGLPWLYLDAGYNILPETGRWYFHMATANRSDAAETNPFRVVGPLCDSYDCYFDVEREHLLASLLQRMPDLGEEQRQVLREEVERVPPTRDLAHGTTAGDIVAIFDVGAYSLEEMFQYCGRLRAEAVMIGSDDRIRLMQARDTDDDLLTKDVAAHSPE